MREHLSEKEARQFSPLTLAFLGDSVYELMIRTAIVEQGNTSVKNLHDAKIQLVCAGYQAKAADRLELTEAEQAVFHRARNAVSTIPKSAVPADYRKATGLEAVFGYLHLYGNIERLNFLFQQVWEMQTELLNKSYKK